MIASNEQYTAQIAILSYLESSIMEQPTSNHPQHPSIIDIETIYNTLSTA